jgi:hypothetical protein
MLTGKGVEVAMMAMRQAMIVLALSCVAIIFGCDQGEETEDPKAAACEGSSGWHQAIIAGNCTDPCPEDPATTITVKNLAKQDADGICTANGMTTCNGSYGPLHGSCSTDDNGDCELSVSIEYSGTCS